jgi:hypothetical protein
VASPEIFFAIIPPVIALGGLLLSDKVRAIIKSVFSHPRRMSVIEKEPDGSYVVYDEEPARNDNR